MSVAAHLGINLAEYDARIRTFIPHYEEMLDVAADAVPPSARVIVDLGVGTGALASACLARVPQARVIGIDADAEILNVAARRLGSRGSFVTGSFLRATIPPCDAAVASFALHHVRTRRAKAKLYERVARALTRSGRLITVDCQPSQRREIARVQRSAWTAHLERFYSRHKAARLLAAWARDDAYMPLEVEMQLMREAGFAVDLLWRKGSFAVLLAAR